MDTMRGNFGSLAESESYYPAEEDTGRETPPATIGQDERRMQVRAYNHWASLLEDKNYPSIEDLEPDNLPDFGPYSVLLDFSSGIEDPGIAYLGDKLATECDIDEELSTLADVPSLSLLSRITDHYMQIIANQAPIGFEAEFVNQRGKTIAYRGILLPYSSDDDTIDFIYGVINWKELADARASDELLLEIDQALEPKLAPAPGFEADGPLTDWADGPGGEETSEVADDADADFATGEFAANEDDALDDAFAVPASAEEDGLPLPSFGLGDSDDGDDDEPEAPARGPQFGSLLKMPLQLSPKPLELGDEHPPVHYGEAFEDPDGDGSELELTDEHLAESSDGPFAEPVDDDTEFELTDGHLAEPADAGFEAPAADDTEADLTVEQPAEASNETWGEPAADDAEFRLTVEHLADSEDNGFGQPAGDDAEATAYEPAPFDPREPRAHEPEPALTEAWSAEPEPAAAETGHDIELAEIDPSEMELGDWLAAAREMAAAARGSEERTRDALYEAIGRAYDFSLAAAEQPADFDELLTDSGLTMQDRAPMTPVVKLVFGADYDKTRLTEYAAALTHAHRLELPRGALGEYLSKADGGLKGVVKAERRLRKEEAGKAVEPLDAPRHALARKLRALPAHDFAAIAAEGSEFALVMIRRTDDGKVVMVGEVPDDVALLERAARHLVG